MSIELKQTTPRAPADQLQTSYIAILPTILLAARVYFRHIQCPHYKDDLVAEVVALGWRWHVRLSERGRNAADFVVTFARFAARSVACGRRLSGKEPVRDVMSRYCRLRNGFTIAPLSAGPEWRDVYKDALSDNTQSPVQNQVQFRRDFGDWVGRLSERNKRVVRLLALGHRTSDVARLTGVTSARISQMRGELRRDYLRFLTDSSAQ